MAVSLLHGYPALLAAWAVAVSFIIYIIRNIFFHPLGHIPGPWHTRFTMLQRQKSFITGNLPRDQLAWHTKYGSVVRLGPHEVSFTDARAWKDIYTLRRGEIGDVEMPKHDAFYRVMGPKTPRTLFSAHYEQHARLRKELLPWFSERNLRANEHVIGDYVDLLIQRLDEKSQDGPVDLRHWFNYYTFDVIGHLGLSSSFENLQNSEYHPWVRAITGFVKEMATIMLLEYLGLGFIVRPVLARQKSSSIHRSITGEKLKERQASNNEYSADLVQNLLKLDYLTPGELRGTVANILVAGSETSATTLTGAVFLLLSNQDAWTKLKHEVRSTFQSQSDISLASIGNLPYLVACLNEALRMYPPIPGGLPRVVPKNGATIAGHFVPEDTVVYVPHWAAYLHAENFTDPLEFRPERFLGDMRYANDRFDVLQPFSYGHRSCIGRSLAYAETRLALARMVFAFDMELAQDTPDWVMKQKGYVVWAKPELKIQLKRVRREL